MRIVSTLADCGSERTAVTLHLRAIDFRNCRWIEATSTFKAALCGSAHRTLRQCGERWIPRREVLMEQSAINPSAVEAEFEMPVRCQGCPQGLCLTGGDLQAARSQRLWFVRPNIFLRLLPTLNVAIRTKAFERAGK